MDNLSVERLDYSSTDYSNFTEVIKNANVDEEILESGSFKGTIRMVCTSHLVVSSFNISKKVLQIGTGSSGYITFVIGDPAVLFNWRKIEMTNGVMGILWKNEHLSVTGAGFNGLPVSIDENYFIKYCRLRGYPQLAEDLRRKEVIIGSEDSLNEIRQLIKIVTSFVHLDDRVVNELVEIKLVDLIFAYLTSEYTQQPQIELSHSKFANTVDYIHEHLSELTSVNQICENVNIPERTLRRLFRKKFDISPKRYVDMLRLNRVRNEIRSISDQSSIKFVASEYNFWHMGQFAMDYKRAFGELPSETSRLSRG